MNAFTNVYFSDFLGDTPASVNIRTGELYLNQDVWPTLNRDQKIFVLLHELGHYVLQTRDEIAADEWAFQQYARLGYSLKESIYVLSNNLTGETPEHRERLMAQAERAKAYDYHNNGNQAYADMYSEALTAFDGDKEQAESACDAIFANAVQDKYASMLASVSAADPCKYMTNTRKRDNCYKKQGKSINKSLKSQTSKTAIRSEVRKTRAYGRCLKKEGAGKKKAGKGMQKAQQGQADVILAGQGIDSQANRRSAVMDGIGGIVDGIFGGGGGGPMGQPGGPNPMMIIGIVGVIGAALFYFMKKKKAA